MLNVECSMLNVESTRGRSARGRSYSTLNIQHSTFNIALLLLFIALPLSANDLPVGSNDPVRILHELLATGRDPIFVVAEADKSSVFTGEQVIVTWTLYNAASVQQEGIGQIPKLADFWVEELDVRNETPQQVF